MAVISGGDQTLLREKKDTQTSTERLYGYGYPSIWSGRVNDGGIARGELSIVYDTGALEAGFVFANIGADLLMFVGSSAGASDKGRVRVRSITGAEAAGTIAIGWTDNIDWADGDYLTIINFYPPMPKYPWFTATAGPIFKKDGPDGDLYVDQNEDAVPQVIMGRDYAGELVGGTLAVQLSAANSQAVADGASISSYAWAAVPTAGVSFDNAAIAAPIATFTADNSKYQISCTVTDSNGKTAIAHRCYIIGGAITEFSRGTITETYDKESVSCSITLTSPETTDSAAIRPVMTWADFAEKTLVIITSEDHYGSTQKTITFRDEAQYTDHNHILFRGYLFSENDDLVDDGSGTVNLTAVSTIPMFLYSLSITGVETPTDWFEMDKTLMTVAGNIFHLLKYHSTLLDIMDWYLPWSDTVKRSANEEFGEGSLLQRAKALISSRLMAMTATAQGEVWIETDLNLRSSADRAGETTTLILTDVDITGTKRARRRHYGDQIRTLLDGGSSTGLLGSFTPYLSASQDIASAEGRPQMINFSRIMLPDQTEANRLSGRIASVANSEYQEVNLKLSGNYRAVFSPGDQQKVDLGNVFAGSLLANIRGYTNLEDVNVIVRSVSNKHSNGYTSVSIEADIMPDEGLTGVTQPTPVVPPDAIAPGGGSGSGSFDEPPAPQYPPVSPDMAVAGAAVGVDEDDGVYWTLDSGATWEARNNGLATAGGADLIWDPWWFTAFGNNSSNPEDVILWWSGTGFVRRSLDAGKNWEDLTRFIDDPPNSWGDSPAPTTADVIFKQISGDIHTHAEFYFIVEWEPAANDWRRWMLKTDDNGSIWVWSQVTTGAWTWNDDFANSPNIWAPFLTPGFLDRALYTFGVGWVSVDTATGSSFSRIIEITTPEFTPTEINTVTMNFDLTLGSFSTGSAPCYYIIATRSGGGIVTISVDFNTAINGAGQTLVLNVNQTDIKQIRVEIRSSVQGSASYSGSVTLNSVTVTGAAGETAGENTNPFEAAGTGRPLGLDVDLDDGSKIWQTAWETDSFLLVEYNSALVFQSMKIFAPDNVTEAQVDARTFYISPYTPPFFGTASLNDIIYVYGRWDDGTVRHVSKSTDGGATFTDIGDSATWGADWVGAFFADDANTLYAFVNGGSPALYRSLNAGTNWTNLSVLPFDVDPHSVSKHPDGRILIANRINGAQMAAYADSAYAAWTNATGSPSFPTAGGGARSMIWVT